MPDGLPVIDVSGLRAPDPAARARVADELGRACRAVGFFYATGHDIDARMLAGVFDVSRRLFALDPASKRALAMSRVGDNRGYVELGGERLDLHAPPDRKDINRASGLTATRKPPQTY